MLDIITITEISPEVQSPVHLVGFIVIVVLNGAFQFGQNPLRATSPRGHDNISGILTNFEDEMQN